MNQLEEVSGQRRPDRIGIGTPGVTNPGFFPGDVGIGVGVFTLMGGSLRVKVPTPNAQRLLVTKLPSDCTTAVVDPYAQSRPSD